MSAVPAASIVIPCFNEARHIGRCLDSLMDGDTTPGDIEVLVVDGGSTDETRQVVADYARRVPGIRLLENPSRFKPHALNIGIRASRGPVVIVADAHATYGRSYVRQCLRALAEHHADNVGGVMVTEPQTPGLMGRAIVTVLSHRLGVGSSPFRVPTTEPKWVDTVFPGCYRRGVFERIGLYNERLLRSQDMEFNIRLRRAGGRILLVPYITCVYYARSTFWAFWRHNVSNGVWAVVPFLYTRLMPVSWRHLVPLAFVLGLAGGTLAGVLFWAPLGWLTLAGLTVYLLAIGAASIGAARKTRDVALAFALPLAFANLHIGYGTGSVIGVVQVALRWLGGTRRPTEEDAWPRLESAPAGSADLASGS